MSENDKQEQLAETITDETKVLPLSQIDAQMKDAYKLLQEAQAQKKPKGEALNEQENSMPSQENTQKQANIQDRELQKDNDEAAPSQTINPLTLEEKRRQQRASKMTIEERRKLQRENPKALEKQPLFLRYVKQANRIDYIFMALLVIAELLNLYISFQMMRCFSVFMALCSFLIGSVLLLASIYVTAKKRRIGFICSSVLAAFFLLGSLCTYQTARFSNKVFANTEVETIMIVAKKDSDMSASSDFNNKRLAVVQSETAINELADAYLADKRKLGYLTKEFSSFQKAYDSLMSDKSDFMVVSAQTMQRLRENDNYSDEQLKLLFEYKKSHKAPDAKAVDITNEAFHVLLIGVDAENNDSTKRMSSAANLLLTVNPKTKKILIHTIPVESRATLGCANRKQTKLAYAGSYGGVACSISTIEKLYGISINYYVKFNLQGIKDVVDALGAITINNDIAFCTEYQNRYHIQQQVCFHQGENRLDGAQAQGYSQAHTFTDGKLEQERHQGEIINGIIKELKQPLSIGKRISLLKAVENNITSNFKQADLFALEDLINAINEQSNNIEFYVIEGEMLQNEDEITNEKLYYFYPKNGQIELVKQRIQAVIEGK